MTDSGAVAAAAADAGTASPAVPAASPPPVLPPPVNTATPSPPATPVTVVEASPEDDSDATPRSRLPSRPRTASRSRSRGRRLSSGSTEDRPRTAPKRSSKRSPRAADAAASATASAATRTRRSTTPTNSKSRPPRRRSLGDTLRSVSNPRHNRDKNDDSPSTNSTTGAHGSSSSRRRRRRTMGGRETASMNPALSALSTPRTMTGRASLGGGGATAPLAGSEAVVEEGSDEAGSGGSGSGDGADKSVSPRAAGGAGAGAGAAVGTPTGAGVGAGSSPGTPTASGDGTAMTSTPSSSHSSVLTPYTGSGSGNVKVVCRFRPSNTLEKERHEALAAHFPPVKDGEVPQAVQIRTKEQKQTFSFDCVFHTDCTQQQVYENVARPVVEGLFHGYNGTLFAYGQTGAGKTYTMEGNLDVPEQRGIIPRMVDTVFELVEAANEDVEFTVKVGMVEIYQERIRDLLDPAKDSLTIHEDKDRGLYIDGVTDVYVTEAQHIFDVIRMGAENRATSATRMNETSSRSHSVFMMTVRQKSVESQSTKQGKLYLVDLAGSEKVLKTGAAGQRLEEAKNINRSLSALGNVINALTDGRSTHVPYRDSKLTRMLQESLGGNSRTALIMNCSPALYNVKETISTLRFGTRAKRIKNKPVVNQERSVEELKVLLALKVKEIERLKKVITDLKAKGGGGGGAGMLAGSSSTQRSSHRRATSFGHSLKSPSELQRRLAAEQSKRSEVESQLNDLIDSFVAKVNEVKAEEANRSRSQVMVVEAARTRLESELAEAESALADADDQAAVLRKRLGEAAARSGRAESALSGLDAELGVLVDTLQHATTDADDDDNLRRLRFSSATTDESEGDSASAAAPSAGAGAGAGAGGSTGAASSPRSPTRRSSMAISTQVEVLRSPDLFSHATVTKVAHGIVGLVQHLRGRFTEQLSARDTELEAVRRDADGVRGELASVTEARDQLLHEVESLTASATAGATEAAQLRAALQQEQAARGVAEEDRDSARALVAKLQGNAEQWAKDHRAVDHLASNLRAELESTKASLAKSQQALQALTDQHHALQAEARETSAKLTTTYARAEASEAAAAAATTRVSRLEAQLAEAQRDVDDHKAQHASAQEAATEHAASAERHKQETARLRERVEGFAAEIAAARADAAQASVAEYKAQVAGLEARLNEVQERAASDLHAAAKAREKELRDTQSQLQKEALSKEALWDRMEAAKAAAIDAAVADASARVRMEVQRELGERYSREAVQHAAALRQVESERDRVQQQLVQAEMDKTSARSELEDAKSFAKLQQSTHEATLRLLEGARQECAELRARVTDRDAATEASGGVLSSFFGMFGRKPDSKDAMSPSKAAAGSHAASGSAKSNDSGLQIDPRDLMMAYKTVVAQMEARDHEHSQELAVVQRALHDRCDKVAQLAQELDEANDRLKMVGSSGATKANIMTQRLRDASDNVTRLETELQTAKSDKQVLERKCERLQTLILDLQTRLLDRESGTLGRHGGSMNSPGKPLTMRGGGGRTRRRGGSVLSPADVSGRNRHSLALTSSEAASLSTQLSKRLSRSRSHSQVIVGSPSRRHSLALSHASLSPTSSSAAELAVGTPGSSPHSGGNSPVPLSDGGLVGSISPDASDSMAAALAAVAAGHGHSMGSASPTSTTGSGQGAGSAVSSETA